MPRPFRHVLLAAALLAIGVPARAEPDALSRLAWLAGCWRDAAAEPGSGEQWMPLAGGMLLGVSRTVKEGRTSAFEFMQIREVGGRPAFIAQPSGRAGVSFPLLRIDNDEAVFENPTHDFPQRIVYRRVASGGLLARIEGLRQGELRGLDFRMTRVSCDTGLERVAAATTP